MTTTVPNQLTLLKAIDEASGGPTSFRPIHYIGSKLRILDSIIKTVDDVADNDHPVCDLFAGSGTVAMALAGTRNVVAVDIQEYSRTICAALLKSPQLSNHQVKHVLEHAEVQTTTLTNIFLPLIEHEQNCLNHAEKGEFGPLCDLLEGGSVIGHSLGTRTTDSNLEKSLSAVSTSLCIHGLSGHADTVVSRYFGGVYFSYLQAIQLDALLSAAAGLSGPERDIVVAATLSTASDVVNTVGRHFAQPVRPRSTCGQPKIHLMRKIEKDRSFNVRSSFRAWLQRYQETTFANGKHQVIRGDYAHVLDDFGGKYSAIYADPPYTRDHYSRFYHVLETMCLRDNPQISMANIGGQMRVSRGLYRENRHQSPFCIRSKAPGAFSDLFQRTRKFDVPLVLSYSPTTEYEGSRPRVMTLAAIRELAEQVYRRVDIREAKPITHSKLTSASRVLGRSTNAERLFVCLP